MLFEEETSALLTNEFGDLYFHDINGSAFNKVGADALYNSHFDEKLHQENTLYILLGTDSALLPKYLMKSGLPEGSRYLFVEPPEVLDRLAQVIPVEGFDERILLTTPENWKQSADDLGFKHYVFLERMEFFPSIGAEDLHLAAYQECGRKLQTELENSRWALTAGIGSEIFFRLQLTNLQENQLSAVCLEDLFRDKTAVILGGGPSLDSTLPWISENRDRLVVIAVSRVARRLLEVGLSPDIFVSIDPHQVSFDVSKEVLKFWEKSILVHHYHVSSKLLGQWRGRKLFLGTRFGWPTHWNDTYLDTQGPTVTNCIIVLALHMGFANVLLAGVDLCFSKEGFTHAQGSNEHQAGPQLGRGQLWVETNGGWLAETTPDFNHSINVIAEQAKAAQKKGCRLVNLSESAAKVPGVEFLPTEAVSPTPLPRPALELILDRLPEDSVETRNDFYVNMLRELGTAVQELEAIKALSLEALDTNARFAGWQGDNKGSPDDRKKLDDIESQLNREHSVFSRIVKQIGIREFLTLAHSDQDKTWEKEDVDRMMQRYYEAYRDSADRILQMLQETQDRLHCRLEEEKASPDFERLISQWETDGQPGRALVWKTRHSETPVPEPVLARFNELEGQYNTVLDEAETLHMARAKIWSQLGPVCGKLKVMFKRNEQNNLKHLLTGLQPLPGEEANALYHLGSGFLAELNKNIDGAMGEYQQVIDLLMEKQDVTAALEEALLRVFVISLDRSDVENALLAGNCLSELSPAYLPYYADLLRLTGDKMSALDVYTGYLEKAQTDIPVMLKLGNLYLELGIKEGARQMFSSVLAREPENTAARRLLSSIDESG